MAVEFVVFAPERDTAIENTNATLRATQKYPNHIQGLKQNRKRP